MLSLFSKILYRGVIGACLGIYPLILEAQLIEGATRLLSCKDCHYSKLDILKSILSQHDQVNADILKLVFPPCLDGAIIRIVKTRDRVPPTKAIAYRQNQDSIITREVNLMLFNGHFSILSDVNFLRMVQFDLYSKSANVMIGSPIVDNYVAHRFGSPVQARQTSATLTQVTSNIPHSLKNTSPRSDRVCSCGGTRFVQTLNCVVCLQCDLHSVLPPLVQSIDIPQSKIDESLDTYTDEAESNSYGDVPPVSPSISYKHVQTQIISHIMDLFWFFFNNANCNGQKLSDKDLSFVCSSPASTTAVNEDTLPQPQLASVDIFLKYDCHNLS